MTKNRRHFIRTAGLITGMVALKGLPLNSAKPSIEQAERSVSAVITRYGSCVSVRRGPGRSSEFKVKVTSLKHFTEVFDPDHLPFRQIFVCPGNKLRFKHLGTEFTIVNVA